MKWFSRLFARSAGNSFPAWQPLTPSGVASFAAAPLWRLLLVQFLLALAAAAACIWFLHAGWFPTVRAAIRRLPESGDIRAGHLDWRGRSPQLLADGHFIAFAVDLDHGGTVRSPAHVQVEFGRDDVRVFSLLGYSFGYCEYVYPRDQSMIFNRVELEPWWGAWSPLLLGIVFGAVLLGLLASWMILATVYWLPVWLMGFFGNRQLDWLGCWKLAGAALMPGALLFTAAIIFYSVAGLDLVQLATAAAAHVVIGWIYLVLGVFAAPRLPFAAAAKKNPFVPPVSGA